MESVGYARALGEEFWRKNNVARSEKSQRQLSDMKEQVRLNRRDLSVVDELIKRLKDKLLPIPGGSVLMSKTEFTVGEWKLYLKAEGLDEWKQPAPEVFIQDDTHPVVKLRKQDATRCCEWLSSVTGEVWRLPTNSEWDLVVGPSKYPWGDYFPPSERDANTHLAVDGKPDPNFVGLDGIKGTAPVMSFKPNAVGFYDIGGNVAEWMGDGISKDGGQVIRDLGWNGFGHALSTGRSSRHEKDDMLRTLYHAIGFRVVCETK